jgi:GGDEF domain-containing protein
MPRHFPERVLLIGDSQRHLQAAISQALPGAQVTSVATVFDGIGELSANAFTAVLAAAEPIERRPEPAVRALRHLAGEGRLVLFGHPTLEILSRKMLEFGCDDYIITPPNPAELQNMFGAPPLRLGPTAAQETEADAAPGTFQAASGKASPFRVLAELPLAEIVLDAMLQHPHDAATAAVRDANSRLRPTLELRYTRRNDPSLEIPPGRAATTQSVRLGSEETGTLHLLAGVEGDAAARHTLARLAQLFARIAALQDRHNRLQKLAITDDLTGLYNARYFRHFLARIVERARKLRFPVTLLLFDIDDFKKYNDQYGHGAGDEILRQTAQLMRRCCREHDLVARIGGDEFAVVFWDKEGPRHPLDPNKPVGPSLPPQTPVEIFERFRRLAASSDFSGLGQSGRGRLSVSGGLAVFPYDAADVPGLIKAADDYLMFKAKKAGKNSIYLVEGNAEQTPKAENRNPKK